MLPSFTKVNKYIFDRNAQSWSIPSGTTCIGAEQCLTTRDRFSGELIHGPKQTFVCYSANMERFPSVRERYWTNYEAVKGKTADEVCAVLDRYFPKKASLVRIHSAGDFFSEQYFLGWMKFANSKPTVRFWAFTKSLPLWIKNIQSVPANVEMQASYGGKWDNLISAHNLKYARVVWSTDEAEMLGLKIDTDDKLAAYAGPSFALLENFSKPAQRKNVGKTLFPVTAMERLNERF